SSDLHPAPRGCAPGPLLLVADHGGDEAHRHPDGRSHEQAEEHPTHDRTGHHGDDPVTGTADNGRHCRVTERVGGRPATAPPVTVLADHTADTTEQCEEDDCC